MAMALQRVEKISAVDQICDSIKRSIAEGTLTPGEKLTSEGQLAEIFGVNRFTVRLALQKLSALGLIETRVGEGSFVRSASIKQYVREMRMFWDESIQESDVARLRCLLESDSILLATENATEEERQELERLLYQYNELLAQVIHTKDDQAVVDLVRADLDFHMQIIRMSHNQLYVEIYTMVRELVKNHIQSHITAVRENARRGKNGATCEDITHKRAYEAIVNRDPEAGALYAEGIRG